ncbi:flippase activity-associated protein Agl23 [Halobacteriaceae archaeon GCM10025711]
MQSALRLRDRVAASPAAVGVAVVTVLALAARLFALGQRVFHWDEARVGYWILRYQESGAYEYRPIIHGPFLPQVNRLLFEVLGPTDFAARLPVAVVGGLLPLAAWLFRDRLRDAEVVALAALFALNPVLLYYSRFMRNDVLLAALMVFALGFFVRAYDTRETDYLYAGVAALALAFTTKENVVVYVGTWVGAFALVFDHRLFLARGTDRTPLDLVWSSLRRAAVGAWRWRVPLVVAVVEFFVIVVVFYAPRPEFGQALTNPAMLPGVVGAGTVGAAEAFWGTWVGGGMQGHQYLPYFEHYVSVLQAGGLVVVLLAAGGFLADRYGGDEPRDLVSFAFYWGLASVFLYPHQRHPGALDSGPRHRPAGDTGRRRRRHRRPSRPPWTRRGRHRERRARARHPGRAGRTDVGHGRERGLREPAGQRLAARPVRPAGKRGATRRTRRRGEGRPEQRRSDVLFYGEHFHVPDEADARQPPVTSGNWHNRLPMTWYLERGGVRPTSSTHLDDVTADGPPVVITLADHEKDLSPRLENYRATTHEITLTNTETVVFVDRDALDDDTRT